MGDKGAATAGRCGNKVWEMIPVMKDHLPPIPLPGFGPTIGRADAECPTWVAALRNPDNHPIIHQGDKGEQPGGRMPEVSPTTRLLEVDSGLGLQVDEYRGERI